MYCPNGRIPQTTIHYLRQLKKICKNIIMIGDNKILPKEIAKIKDLVSYCEFSHHKEYNFGSYKRGHIYAQEKGLLQTSDELIICNDSCYAILDFEPAFSK